MEPLKFFDMVELLDPHCPSCSSKLDYGVSTKYNDKIRAHICNSCGI